MARRYRPEMPARVKLNVVIRQRLLCACGCGSEFPCAEEIHFDHSPPLALREYDPVTKLYTPSANDAAHIYAMIVACHLAKTNGKRATSYGSDKHAIAKVARIVKGGNKPRGRPLTGGRKLEGRGFQKPPPGYEHKWDKRTMGRRT